MAEELLINVNIEGERELDKVTSKVEKLGKTGNKTQTELQKLRNELKEQKNAMLQAEEGSEEYGQALQRAAQIQQRMTDISKQIRAGMMGVGEVMANVSRTASGMAGGFGALTGAAQLFGIENEAVINSIARLQSIMSVASGLAQFADSIDALQELMGALRASTAMSSAVVGDLADETEIASEAQDGLITSMKTGEKAATGLSGSFKGIVSSLGPMLLITAAVTAAMFAIEKLIEAINKVPREVELKFKMQEEVFKEVQKEEERIAKIRQDIRLSSGKKELDLLKKLLVQEGIATEEQLRGLNDEKALLNAAFWDEYLKNAKAVAENEYLIRKDIELRLQKELAQIKLQELRNSQTYLQGFASIFGFGELPKAVKEFDKLNQEIETFQKAFYKNGNLDLKEVSFNLSKNVKQSAQTIKEFRKEVIEDLKATGKGFEVYINRPLGVEQAREIIESIAKRWRALQAGFSGGDFSVPKLPKELTTVNHTGAITKIDNQYSTDLEAEFERIDQKRLDFITKQREGFEKQMERYMSYADSLASITDSIVGMYDARMTALDNYYAAEARLIEQSSLNEEEKNRKLAELDQERYNKQKVLFEQQKNWQKAFVMLNLASGLMNVYTRATLPVALGGTPSPFNWIQAGLETAALIGQSVASIAQINAQQLQAPSTSTSGGSIGSISALSPTKTSLTTKEENLNMMQRSGQKEVQYEVKVTEINKVQDRVRVRESNSSY